MLYIDQLETVLMAAFLNGVTTELVSEPGIGKSSVIRQTAKKMAARLNAPFCLVVRHLSTMDPTDVAGPLFISRRKIVANGEELEMESAMNSYPALFPNSKDKVFLPDGSETTVERHGSVPKFGFVFLDELRQAPHDVQKPAARFMDEQCIGDWSLDMFGGKWGVVAASNRAEDRSGANKDLAFITNRKMILNVRSSVQILCNYFEATGMHHLAIGYVRAFPGSVFTPEVPKDDKPFPTPRSFERCSKLLMTLGNGEKLATNEEAVEVACGLIGEGKGPEYIGYLRLAEHMVTIDEIIADPAKARIPDRADVMWAVTQMMVHHADKDNAIKLFRYVMRIPREMQLVAIASISSKVKQLQYNAEYSKWAAENRDLLLAAYAADRRLSK